MALSVEERLQIVNQWLSRFISSTASNMPIVRDAYGDLLTKFSQAVEVASDREPLAMLDTAIKNNKNEREALQARIDKLELRLKNLQDAYTKLGE